ncbi:TIGR02678 family protein [Rhodococcus rhodnii]|uniref:TIGR02678 family protein n=2 Tax=Rhodococcus rhodnii TaxID=38312 RepID=R7WT06_9NOCA|nr:TIGR02678 family protein [Rhodococcus rhodnii]EOM78406.1 hypothetical protein Rrhod_0235 [Rhodococcus rhodnii LMG 5362]TXG91223.1 TIGR02678 family protein [Rhodococcus rhodnii]
MSTRPGSTAPVPGGVDAESYRRALRTLLLHRVVTPAFPDRTALVAIRRWTSELRDDLHELFGYRLEVTETCARVWGVRDRPAPAVPATTSTDRPFDRRRYAYLALALAALGRGADQITLTELAASVVADTAHTSAVALDVDRAADRDAFVDAATWLVTRGALRLADGDASGWAADPAAGEALYDVDRAVVAALFRPDTVLDSPEAVARLLSATAPAPDENAAQRSRRLRRALVEQPVVYAAELGDADRLLLARPATAAAVAEPLGLVVEHRREGIALVDPAGRFSDVRFPATGTIAQVSLLLAGEIAEYAAPCDRGEDPPFVARPWLDDTVAALTRRYGRTFAARWRSDVPGLADAALDMLDRLGLIAHTDGGVLALPLLARFRGVTVAVRTLDGAELFAGPEPPTGPDSPTDPEPGPVATEEENT